MPLKRMVTFADGTWGDPEDDHPTNVSEWRGLFGLTTQAAFSKLCSTTGESRAFTSGFLGSCRVGTD